MESARSALRCGLATLSLVAAAMYPITRGGAPAASLAVYRGEASPLSASVSATDTTTDPSWLLAARSVSTGASLPTVLPYGAKPGPQVIPVSGLQAEDPELQLSARVTGSLAQIVDLAVNPDGKVVASFTEPLPYPGEGASPRFYHGDLLVVLGDNWDSYTIPASVTLMPQPKPIKPKVLSLDVKPSIQLTPSGAKPSGGGGPRSAISLSGGSSGAGHPAPAGRSSGGGGGGIAGGSSGAGGGGHSGSSGGSGGGSSGGTGGGSTGGSAGSGGTSGGGHPGVARR